MKTTPTMMKCIRAAAVALSLALLPGLASAQSAMVQGSQEIVLGATPSFLSSTTLLDSTLTAPAARGASEVGALWFGGGLGLDLASGYTGFAVRLQMVYTLSEIDPKLYFELVGNVSASFGSNSQFYGIIPAARIRYGVSPKVAIYGDGGIGLDIVHVSVGGFSETKLGGILHFGSGFLVNLSPRVNLMIEPVGVNVHFYSGGSTFIYGIMVGALFRT
jgi:hypothetical protein